MNEEESKTPQKERVRGCAVFDGQKFTFTPEKKGEAVQKNIVTSGKSKMYETAGSKKSSIVAHLVADANDPDPAFQMTESLRELYSQTNRTFPEVQINDVDIFTQEQLKIRVSKERQEVRVYMSFPLGLPNKMNKDLHMLQARLAAEFYVAEDKIKKLTKQ